MYATLKANESFNLTAIKDEEKFRELMILDSVYPLKYFDFTNKKVIDIGTGNTEATSNSLGRCWDKA